MSSDFVFALLAVCAGVVVFGLLVTGAVLMIRDTVRRRGRWGLNLQPAVCLKCGTPAPVVRVPASFSQALWGGWTCAQCGFELDKWGHPVSEQPFPAKWSARLDDPAAPSPPPVDPRTRQAREDLHRGDYRG